MIARSTVAAFVALTLLPFAEAELIGRWTFDEGDGTNVADSSGRGNHGTLVNASTATRTTGIVGSALYFDGTTGAGSSYVNIPDSDSLRIANAISFTAWVRCDDISLDAPILGKEGSGKVSYWFGAFGSNFEGASPGNFGLLLSDNGATWTRMDRDQGSIPQGVWVHLASTWDISDGFLAIGVNSLYTFTNIQTAFKGAVDDVRLYNHALAIEDIGSLYQPRRFRITVINVEGNDVRLTWPCIPGRSYMVQTGPLANSNGDIEFTDHSLPISVPSDFALPTCDYLDEGAINRTQAFYYRVKLLP